jgi:hypothetical protein
LVGTGEAALEVVGEAVFVELLVGAHVDGVGVAVRSAHGRKRVWKKPGGRVK